MEENNWITIDPNMGIVEIIDTYPELVTVLTEDYEFHCVNCLFSGMDTLIEGASLHGIEGEDFKDMLKHLEQVINEERTSFLAE
jgi:hybrid cluster-associated redox disulfide protein